MSAPKEDPIEAILKSPLKEVLVKGFAEVYKQQPAFPIEFFSKWLKNYSRGQQRQKELESTRTQKQQRVAEEQRKNAERVAKENEAKQQKNKKISQIEEQFNAQISKTNYLVDLLAEYLPTQVEKSCQERGVQLTGCYIGELKHRHKKIEEHNFEAGAQLDTQNPKIIEYLGATKSHQFMVGQILPNETGKTYEVFKEEEPPAEQPQEGKVPKPKKKYLYVQQVQRDAQIYHFRYPKLGAYACFPLKVKSCLYSPTFDKAIGDYKAFVKNKEEVEKEYNQKLQEARSAYEQAKRKYEQHEGNEQDAQYIADHANLQQQFKKNETAFKQVESNPPVIEPFNYETKNKEYVVGIDTMGLDSQISEQVLSFIEKKVEYFRAQWEEKEFKMLLDDVLLYMEEQNVLQGLDNYFKDQEKGFISQTQHQIKEQFPNKEKEAEYELTLLKVSKFFKILQEQPYLNSLNAYLHYHLPKYTEIIQIALMLLGHKKEEINLPRSNTLGHRKWIQKESIEKLVANLQKYELRRDQSETVQNEYKINKLLQRLEKVDGEAVGKYNSWLYALLTTLKQICWARIQCRDAKIEAYDARVKAKNERDAEIAKYQEEMDKALQAAKAELTQETLPTFNEQEWNKTYTSQNVRPQPLAVEQLKQFLDIE